jgi:hypothetical protein
MVVEGAGSSDDEVPIAFAMEALLVGKEERGEGKS